MRRVKAPAPIRASGMDKSWLKKGLAIVASGLIRLDTETDNALYFKVRGDTDEYDVRIEKDHVYNCTCHWGSMKGAKTGSPCSHVVAALIFAASEYQTPGVRPR